MSSAAKTLGLPTSTVSRSLTRLQKRLGVALLRNVKTGVALTDAGIEYLPFCRDALTSFEEGKASVSRQAEQPVGVVRVACPVAMARDVLAPLIPSLSLRHPALGIELLSYAPGQNMESIRDADVLFHVFPSEKQRGYTQSFPATRRGVYTSRRYADVAGLPQTPEDLKAFQCVGSRGIPAFAQWYLQSADREVSLQLEFKHMAADPYTLRNLLVGGVGITMLPVWMALEQEFAPQLIRVLPDWEPSPVLLFATFALKEQAVPKLRSFLAFMTQHIGTSLDPRAAGKNATDCFV